MPPPCRRCSAQTSSGARCSRPASCRIACNDVCWQHSEVYNFRRDNKAAFSAEKYKSIKECGRPTCRPFTYGNADRLLGAAAGAAMTIGHGVQVKPSNIPTAGLGLFSGPRKAFLKGEIITEYCGRVITRLEANERRRRDSRLASHMRATGDHRYIIDGLRNPRDGLGGGSFANQGPGINAKIINVGDKVYLMATKNIPNNEEVLVHYGADYVW
jgi:hypothetical protein